MELGIIILFIYYKVMSGTKYFLIFLAITSSMVFVSAKIMSLNLKENDKSINLILIFLIISSILTFTGIGISYNIQPKVKKIEPEEGEKGNIGLRGNIGENAKCGIKCSDNACYLKILDHITIVYNVWCKINGEKMLQPGTHINNNFIKNKTKEICKSLQFSALNKKYGNHKLDIHGKKITKKKCNIDKDCGIYDYIFQKWTEWILIILKYKNGKQFLDTENLNDNHFNNLIEEDDLIKNENLVYTKEWIFDLGNNDCYNNNKDECLSLVKFIEAKDIGKYKFTSFYKFYSLSGVPDAFNSDMSQPIKNRITNLRGPFDEIQEYDAWYWGSDKITQPKVIQKCSSDDYKKLNEKEDKFKIKLTNDYELVWSSEEARQAKILYTINNSRSLSYEDNLVKGNKIVNIYRPKDFYDSSEKDTEFKSYKPLGYVIVDNNQIFKKRDNDPMYPKYLKQINDSKSSNKNTNGPRFLSVLISSPNLELPIRYDKLYSSVRNEGFKKKKGFSVWRPIAPEGYVCLGDVVSNNPYEPPSKDSIRCVPESFVQYIRGSSGVRDFYRFETPSNTIHFNGSRSVVLNSGRGEKVETDSVYAQKTNNIIYTKIYNPENLILLEKNENHKTENNELINSDIGDYTSNLNLFRLNSNNSFYRLNKNLIYDDRVLFKPLNVPKQIVKTKYPKDYSIFKLYED